jgi:hypothetical protein
MFVSLPDVSIKDKIYLETYKKCKYLYLNLVNGKWIKSDVQIETADIILEKSLMDGYWIFVKIGNSVDK